MTKKLTLNSLFSSAFVTCSACVAFLPATALNGQIYADFSDGVGTSSASTQFTGKAGEGWTNAWSTLTDSATMNTAVLNDNPIVGSDNYLKVDITATSDKANRRASLRRTFDEDVAGGAHTISFSVRIDNLSGWNSGDYFGILAASTERTSTSDPNQTWGIMVSAASSGNVVTFRDGDTGKTSVSSEIAFEAGVTYNFVLNIDPENSSWQANVSSSNNESFSSGQMEFRAGTMGRVINVNTLLNGEGDQLSYSLSGISITPIPEPAHVTLAMLGVSALAVCVMRRRK